MEVWLESLSMHLSVGMPLPADLLFDIQHYRGISPSSSGSTTPEGISSGHRSPALEPITEGKPSMNQKVPSINDMKKISSVENLKPIIKVSSADNLVNKETQLKPIIKVSSSDILNANHENTVHDGINNKNSNNDLKTKSDQRIDEDSQSKPISINELPKKCSIDVNKDCCSSADVSKSSEFTSVGVGFRNIGAVPLRKVPKNFIRNRFSNEKFDFSELLNRKVESSNIDEVEAKSNEENTEKVSLEGLKDTATPSKVTQKYVSNSKYTKLEETPKKTFRETESSPSNVKKSNIFSNSCLSITRDIPDVVSSTFRTKSNDKPPNSLNDMSNSSCGVNRNLSKQTGSQSRALTERNSTKPLMTSKTFPIPYKKCHSYEEPSLSSKNVSLQRYGENTAVNENISTTNESNPSSSSSIVKNIIETLNRRERNRFEFPNRSTFGRSSLKVMGSPKAPVCRSGSPEEFTAL